MKTLQRWAMTWLPACMALAALAAALAAVAGITPLGGLPWPSG